ncbi:MAG: hypothetical protein Kow00103_13690 [Candidatus Caldatribacteriota bacterium]
MQKIFGLILMVILLVNCFIFFSSADGGLITQLFRDIIEPNQLAMIVFDEMVERIVFQIDYEGNADDFAWIIPVPSYPKLFPKTLREWLNNNDYAFPEEGEEILDYYIQKDWFFIAMKIQLEEEEITGNDYSGVIQPLGVMFFSEKIIYPLKISTLSVPSWGTEVLIYVFSDERLTFNGAQEEYSALVTPLPLREYPILHNLIDEPFTLTKLRKNFIVEEMSEDLVFQVLKKNIKINSIFDFNSPLSQVVLFLSVFILILKKGRKR